MFQSTLPMQGETQDIFHCTRDGSWFQSTLPMQGETWCLAAIDDRRVCFNPLSLCRERREAARAALTVWMFQSTLPMQGETRRSNGERPGGHVSIHSPYAGRDAAIHVQDFGRVGFQSTLPMQGETPDQDFGAVGQLVSIHSPYAGRDKTV